jgi:photosystem II oxygen-evolving enhancer protein 2
MGRRPITIGDEVGNDQNNFGPMTIRPLKEDFRKRQMLKRFAVIALLLVGLMLQGCTNLGGGFKPYIDALDGYKFLYPNGWLQVAVSDGPDVVFRDLIEETENVSVVVSAIDSGKKLTDLGDASQVGLRLAQKVLAPAGSDREAELLSATERDRGDKTYYNLEYLIKLPDRERHHLASVAVSRGKLYTLNISAPERRWDKVSSIFQTVSNSFTVD